jgi:hypothetical protein
MHATSSRRGHRLQALSRRDGISILSDGSPENPWGFSPRGVSAACRVLRGSPASAHAGVGPTLSATLACGSARRPALLVLLLQRVTPSLRRILPASRDAAIQRPMAPQRGGYRSSNRAVAACLLVTSLRAVNRAVLSTWRLVTASVTPGLVPLHPPVATQTGFFPARQRRCQPPRLPGCKIPRHVGDDPRAACGPPLTVPGPFAPARLSLPSVTAAHVTRAARCPSSCRHVCPCIGVSVAARAISRWPVPAQALPQFGGHAQPEGGASLASYSTIPPHVACTGRGSGACLPVAPCRSLNLRPAAKAFARPGNAPATSPDGT